MRLDGDRRAAEWRRGLDHIGIQRSLHQEADVPRDVLGRLLEHIDERVADATPLFFRILDVRQRAKEEGARIHDPQIDPEMRPEGLLHLLPFAQTQQSVIHENAGQPVADRAVPRRRCYRRIHAAREAADRPLRGTDQPVDSPYLLLDEVARRAIGRAAGDLEQEIVQHLPTPRGVRYLGVEQHAEDRPGLVLEPRDRRVRARSRHTKAWRWLLDAVAVTGPHGDTSLGLEPGEQPGRVPHRDVSAAVLALGRRRHFAAGQVGHELHAVANGEDGWAELEQLRIGGWGTPVEHRNGAAGKDDGPRIETLDEPQVPAPAGGWGI